MLAATRRFAKSWAAAIIIGLLIISFAVFGINDVFNFSFSNSVIKAGDREVSQRQFARQFDNVKSNIQEQQGRAVTVAEMVENGLLTMVLEGVAREEGFLAWAWRTGIRPAQSLILDRIRAEQSFFDPVTGRFDQDAYVSRLASVQLTPAEFERSLRDAAAAEHYFTAMFAGLRAPRVYGAVQAAYLQETRDGRWFIVDPSVIGPTPAPTEEQLAAFLGENQERLRRPERRALTLIRFTPTQVSGAVEVSEEEIQERFEFLRPSLSTPERRSFVTITAPDMAAAQRVAQRLRAGEDPAAVARSLNTEPVTYDSQPRTAVADPRVGAAAFALEAGQVSDPVQGELGIAVVKLDDVTPGQEATLAEHRGRIVAELRQRAATARVYELVESYSEARAGGASMAEAARELGLETVSVPPVAADGSLANGQRLPAPDTLFEAAFDIAAGEESDVIDAGNDEYFAVRVDRIVESALPTLDDVRAPLTEAWTRRETGRRLRERADALAAEVRGGADIAAVAASAGAALRSGDNLSRQPQSGGPDQGVLAGLFGQGVDQVFTGQVGETAFVVGRVDAVRAPAPALAGRSAEAVRPRVSLQLYQEAETLAQAAAGRAVGVRTYPANARRALGLAAEEESAAAPAAE